MAGCSWHPSPTGHLLLADMLFMHYAKVFLGAVDRLQDVAPGTTATQLREMNSLSRKSLRSSLGLGDGKSVARRIGDGAGDEGSGGSDVYMGGGRGSILPRPVWCIGWRFCEGAGSYRCANTYFPLAGKEGSRLVDMVSERTPAILNRNHEQYLTQPSEGHWTITLNEESQNFLRYLKSTPPKGMHLPIDMKWVLIGDKQSGPIEFEFETIGAPLGRAGAMHPGKMPTNTDGTMAEQIMPRFDDLRVAVCRPDFIDHIKLTDATGVKFSVDGVEASVVELAHDGLHSGSCVLLDAEVGAGRHILTVEPLLNGAPFVAVSHVLYPA